MKLSMIGQEKGDLLIQVIVWAGLTVYCNLCFLYSSRIRLSIKKNKKILVALYSREWYLEFLIMASCSNIIYYIPIIY